MPYITPDERESLDLLAKIIHIYHLESPGQLNYIISEVAKDYLLTHGVRYGVMNEVAGALECAKMEMYRRVAAPYEDDMATMNGDVWDIVPQEDKK